ncbi:MAG: amidohydrolase family protein [Planctomycetota bacterium]|jgi:predicted TIM-barrel fold metal-dependent hydrolase
MIVDCHTHMDCGEHEAEASEQPVGTETVDVCIVLADASDSSEESNKKVSDYVSKHNDKRVGFAFVEPRRDRTSVKDLIAIREKLGLEGTVLYCSECGFHPADSGAMRFYESAEELGLAVFFHNGGPLGSDAVLAYGQPFLLDEIARTFPSLVMVVGNMGAPFVAQTLAAVGKHKNVYADLTIRPSNVWEVYNVVMSAHEWGVMDKLLFGSGFPLGRAGECIETLLGFNKLLADTNLPTVPRGEIRQIIERNTLEVLGIERPQG